MSVGLGGFGNGSKTCAESLTVTSGSRNRTIPGDVSASLAACGGKHANELSSDMPLDQLRVSAQEAVAGSPGGMNVVALAALQSS